MCAVVFRLCLNTYPKEGYRPTKSNWQYCPKDSYGEGLKQTPQQTLKFTKKTKTNHDRIHDEEGDSMRNIAANGYQPAISPIAQKRYRCAISV
jgi:hypothetical protein